MIINKYKLEDILLEKGIPLSDIFIADRKYKTVSKPWIIENWRNWVAGLPNKLRKAIGTPKWLDEGYDCDNHSLSNMTHGQTGNALTTLGQPKELRSGLAFGTLWYIAVPKPRNRRNGGHAINFWINYKGNLKFWEPAEGREVFLYEKEIDSIFFVLCA